MVGEIMRSDIVKLKREDSLHKALEIMYDHNINGAPVVDKMVNSLV